MIDIWLLFFVLHIKQWKYTLRVFKVQDAMGETWLCGEHFPCKNEVLVLVVVVDIFPFNRGAANSITTYSSTTGSIEVSSTVA